MYLRFLNDDRRPKKPVDRCVPCSRVRSTVNRSTGAFAGEIKGILRGKVFWLAYRMGVDHTDIVKLRQGQMGLRSGGILIVAPVANNGPLPVRLTGRFG